MGNAYDDQGKFTQAIESYKKAIELDPDYALAYSNLGVAYHNNDDFTTALIYYKKAARLGHQGSQDWLKKNGYDW
jgi:superkiller protein 3